MRTTNTRMRSHSRTGLVPRTFGNAWHPQWQSLTGNGKVDVHIRYGDKRGLIEVKSFVDDYLLDRNKDKAASYAK